MAKNGKDRDSAEFQTTTAHQARLQMYQATRRPKNKKREIDTPWGSAVVIGKLGQAHADFVESVFYNAEKSRELENGAVQLLVDPYKVRTSVGGGKQYSYEALHAISIDVMAAVIDLKVYETGLDVIGHIFDEIDKSPMTRPNKLDGGERHMWRVTVSKAFVELMRHDLKLSYNPMSLAKIETGVAQAIARLVMTHTVKEDNDGGWYIDTLLKQVGIDPAKKTDMRNRRREVRNDADNLAEIGIIVDGEKIKRVAKAR